MDGVVAELAEGGAHLRLVAAEHSAIALQRLAQRARARLGAGHSLAHAQTGRLADVDQEVVPGVEGMERPGIALGAADVVDHAGERADQMRVSLEGLLGQGGAVTAVERENLGPALKHQRMELAPRGGIAARRAIGPGHDDVLLLLERSRVEGQQPRSQPETLLDVVRDHEDGHAVVAPQPQDQLVHVRGDARVQRTEGLVQQQDLRLADDGLRDRQPRPCRSQAPRRSFRRRPLRGGSAPSTRGAPHAREPATAARRRSTAGWCGCRCARAAHAHGPPRAPRRCVAGTMRRRRRRPRAGCAWTWRCVSRCSLDP